jgi:hypothetical protein
MYLLAAPCEAARLPSCIGISEEAPMTQPEYMHFVESLCGIAAVMVLLPIVLYLCGPWATRRDRLLANLPDDSLRLYYKQFYPAINPPPRAEICNKFKGDFARQYGRRHYALPLFLLAVLAAVSAFGAARSLQALQNAATTPTRYALPLILVSALAGGFTWVISDLVERLRRRDFTVSDVYNASFRILISMPFGWAIAQLAPSGVGVPLAFLLGSFPTGTLFKIGRRLAATKLGVADDPKSGALALEKLQSITKTNAERFYDEGVSTVVQLAYADPIDLTIRTNFDFSYVIDCVSQALLWMYFENMTGMLAIYSLRGAQEAASLFDSLGDQDPKVHAQAAATLKAIAGALNIPQEPLRSTLEQVARDPYTEFLCTIWTAAEAEP